MVRQVDVPAKSLGSARGLFLGCGALFSVPFIVAGMAMVVQAIRTAGQHDVQGTVVAAAAGGAFMLFGIAIVVMIWWGTRETFGAIEARAQHPNEPWLWRSEWGTRDLADSQSVMTIGLWIFASIWCLICTPITYVIVHDALASANYSALFGLIFPAVGIGLLCAAVYRTLQRRKFGRSQLHLERVPIAPGSHARAELEIGSRNVPDHGFVATLKCLRRVTTGMGRSRTTTETVLWQQAITIPPGAIVPAPNGMRVPVALEIPADAPKTDITDSFNEVVWVLEVTADVPGIDYSAKFSLPVF